MSEKEVIFKYDEEKKQKMAVTLKRENTTWKEVLTEMCDDYLKKHGESNNPQSTIEQFNKPVINAVPNLYNRDGWLTFFDNLKKEKDYQEVVDCVNFVVNQCNKHREDDRS